MPSLIAPLQLRVVGKTPRLQCDILQFSHSSLPTASDFAHIFNCCHVHLLQTHYSILERLLSPAIVPWINLG